MISIAARPQTLVLPTFMALLCLFVNPELAQASKQGPQLNLLFKAAKPHSTLDGLLTAMEKDSKWKGYFAKPVHIFKSQKSHGSKVDHLSPQIIFFDGKKELIFTVSTNPKEKIYQKMQIMELVDDSFQMSELDFTAGKANLTTYGNSVGKQKEACQACHGKPARPIWDSYAVWPGVFFGNRSGKVGSKEMVLLFESCEEKNLKTKARLRNSMQSLKTICENKNHYGAADNVVKFDEYLFSQNIRRLQRLLEKDSKTLETSAALLVGAALRCENLTGFFPDSLGKSFDFQHLGNEMQRDQQHILNNGALKLIEYQRIHGPSSLDSEIDEKRRDNSTNFAYIHFESVAIIKHIVSRHPYAAKSWKDTGHWSIYRKPGENGVSFATEKPLVKNLIADWVCGKNLELAAICNSLDENTMQWYEFPAHSRDKSYPEKACEKLAALSQKTIAQHPGSRKKQKNN